MCLQPKEIFTIELESTRGGRSIDIVCGHVGVRAAIELECFRKGSNRAKVIDMYHVLEGISWLQSYSDFQTHREKQMTSQERNYPRVVRTILDVSEECLFS